MTKKSYITTLAVADNNTQKSIISLHVEEEKNEFAQWYQDVKSHDE